MATAQRFRSAGATVLVAPGEWASQGITDLYSGFPFIDGRVRDPLALQARSSEVVARYGRLDLVIFCSGSLPPPDIEKTPVFVALSASPPLRRGLLATLNALLKAGSVHLDGLLR
jgi:NAD(P)-dependent dehydrogenase (short-subunit alcohol dehydrogenase family)